MSDNQQIGMENAWRLKFNRISRPQNMKINTLRKLIVANYENKYLEKVVEFKMLISDKFLEG